MKNNLNFLTAFALLSLGAANAQTGVGNTAPKATLDVTGTPATATTADGIIAPRITGDQLTAKTAYGTDQTGAIVYVTAAAAAPAGATVNVTVAGFYYFDGTAWQKVGANGGGLVSKGTAATDGITSSFTITNSNVLTTSVVTVNYLNSSNEIISHAITSIAAGSFTVQFAAIPRSGGSILYTIVN